MRSALFFFFCVLCYSIYVNFGTWIGDTCWSIWSHTLGYFVIGQFIGGFVWHVITSIFWAIIWGIGGVVVMALGSCVGDTDMIQTGHYGSTGNYLGTSYSWVPSSGGGSSVFDMFDGLEPLVGLLVAAVAFLYFFFSPFVSDGIGGAFVEWAKVAGYQS